MPAGSLFSPASRLGVAATGGVALASLALQYALILLLTRDNIGPMLGTVRFFSYFTILSNLAVSLVALHVVFARTGFFTRPSVRAAVALYIGITGLVYAVILRHTWNPEGAMWWSDAGLHYAVPALYLAWWLWLAPRGALAWRQVAGWLLFPAVYVAWIFLRGEWLGEYPYPFIDVAQLGWQQVLVNAFCLLLLFLVVGLALVALDRLLARRQAAAAT
ncbi:Pr6Pr family membrane protein [Pseudoxanthomonas putridarboris]|uniref:Pr6Pr family membrane protein n=1 Tax=Pseudoxanthomonas putridarboris TaxID=752605 RepID=A0ABU9J1Q0_9GAMM